ncbi:MULTISPECIES: PA2169 family four-helix-bundle protein [Ramlibacter]|uniref:PA2169 family four-helix-bundle protein n=1 Tax=Ramlibacter aquaticus TaxID=2780094 RepID=A0ABR9SHT0_9BURK|nr:MULTISPECIES: PA2169 family four-helix-bundle protein [Ramlibacter]MBE7941840.1 PA2169 family four-helix-bundle protein [Ramlibacter aquaticus]
MAAEDKDMNRDPVTEDNGSHPVGTGVGAAGGAVAGVAAGAMGGPVGMAVGGVVGAIIGGLAGRAAAQAVDPQREESHWRDNYDKEPYYEKGRSYDDYAPAYRLGLSGRAQHEGDWDSAEPRLASEWESNRGSSSLDWDQARPASRAAWDRVDSGSAYARDDALAGSSMNTGLQSQSSYDSSRQPAGSTATRGAAAAMGEMQTAGDSSGDRDDTIDVLQDLAECSLDGAYGFRACAEQAQSADLKSMFSQRAQECERAAQELNEQIRGLGGSVEEHGSASAAVHRGWVSVKTTLSTMDDKAVLEECERGEDNAVARYRKALQKPLPAQVKLIVERQMQGVQRNHDQVKQLRNQYRGRQA